MHDTHHYLLQCENVIRKQNTKKVKKSKKASILHCIFSQIRIIDASTFVNPKIQNVNSPESEVAAEEEEGASPLSSECDDLAVSTIHLPNMLKDEDDEDQVETIYGFPTSLLKVISKTSILADEIDAFRIRNPRLAIPQDLERRALEIETYVCSQDLPGKDGSKNVSREALSIAESISRAMHHALLVYFFRRVRHTNPVLLQAHVESVIDHLTAHEQAKKRFKLDAGGIVWPSFIVACEATSPELRQRALGCLCIAGQAGFRNNQPAVMVAKEVWRRRDHQVDGADWVSVVRDWNINMVLT